MNLLRNGAVLGVALAACLALVGQQAHAQGAFSAPVSNTFTIDFDSASSTSPGPTEFAGDGFIDNFSDNLIGETAFWGSFGGGPDTITAEILEDVGPDGVGDHAARLTVTDASPGGYFAGLRFLAKGLRLGNSGGATASGDEPIPDFDTGLFVTAPVKTNISGAQFRINFDTGAQSSSTRYDDPNADDGQGSFVTGSYPGFYDLTGPGSRVLKIGPAGDEIGELPVDTWGTQTTVGGVPVALNENPSDLNLWSNASFGPFFFRSPRSFEVTRVGVTFPGGGNPGEVLISEFTLTGPDVLKYHMADYNTDEMVDAADIDLLTEAINILELNATLPVVPDNNFNGRIDFEPVPGVHQFPGVDFTFAEKFSITPTDDVLNDLDVDELVLNILGTNYGDVDLDGDVDNDDKTALEANLGGAGPFGWADGDLDGDDDVDADDLAILNANLGGAGQAGDFNNDGRVDNGDLNLLLGNWGSATVPPEWTNGFVSPVDNGELNDLLGNWGFGVSSSAVPEPSSLVLLAAAGAAIVSLRQRG